MSGPYTVAPIFLIRMAGVPFDEIRKVATSATCAIAREIIASRDRVARATTCIQELLAQRDNGLSPEEFHGLRAAVRSSSPVRLTVKRPEIIAYNEAVAAATALETDLDYALEAELTQARIELLHSAEKILRRYLVFGGNQTLDLVAESLGDKKQLPPRNKRARERERHLLLYLQRVATKNDTFSEFGPTAWGRIDRAVEALVLQPQPGIAKREAFLERWTAHAAAAAINADQRNPNVQVPALEPYAFDSLRAQVESWAAGPARQRWSSMLQPITELPQRFATSADPIQRRAVLDEARARLQDLGAIKSPTRFLYSATNPIAEECFRESGFVINEGLVNRVATEAAPWIDLWRDSYAFIASRVAAGLRRVMEKAAPGTKAFPLPTFLRVCEEARLPLTGPGLVALAAMPFQEVKAAFRKRLEQHANVAEYELTADDCHVVRNTFDYPAFDEYTYPSADLQLAAGSVDAVRRGEYQWILAELHPPIALLHHGGYWSCPDKASLNRALASTIAQKPSFYFGFFAADFTAHTTVRLFDALPEFSNFVSAFRSNPGWRKVAPEDAEVFIDPESGDVAVRRTNNHEYLGSFARAWVIPLGFHPFQFSLGAHTPRLRCGRVIVQRRNWTVNEHELPPGNYTGVSRDLVIAIEQLRAEKNWPRYIYVRPTEQALRRSGAEGRDKDTKPVFIDLESYLFHEIFHRWLTKAGELEVSEMLPDPEQLLWQEADGRRTFEMRSLIVPSA